MVVGVLFGVLAICLLLTVPIAVSLGIATIAAGFSLNAVTGNQMLTMLAQTTITASDNTSLLAMPFFMLCGSLMDRSGIAKRLIDVAEAIVGEATGGLGATTIVAAMLFAAISGSGRPAWPHSAVSSSPPWCAAATPRSTPPQRRPPPAPSAPSFPRPSR